MKLHPLNGILLIDKPKGWTSHDVISKLRRITAEKRIGHAGTLDPLATGLLVILLGSATRLSDYFISDDKEYEVTIKLGEARDTDDSEGEIIERREVASSMLDTAYAEKILSSFIGEQEQVPPLFSALKKEGKVAHKEARKGRELHIAPRRITIHSIEDVRCNRADYTWSFRVAVSKGTYIRALARDIGAKLGTGAHVSSLKRLRSGALDLSRAQRLEKLESLNLSDISAFLINPKELFKTHLITKDSVTLSGKFLHLQPGAESDFKVETDFVDKALDESISAFSYDGRLLGFYELETDKDKDKDKEPSEYLRPKTIFPGGIQGPNISSCVAALGIFDGVHLGHQALLDELVAQAQLRKVKSVVVTFDPLPEIVLNPHTEISMLMSLEQRISGIKSRGVDEVVIIPFTSALSELSASDFVEKVLLTRIHPELVIVGTNFRFAQAAQAGAKELKELLNSEVKIFELKGDEHVYSSTLVRNALAEADIEKAHTILGRYPSLVGRVVEGKKIGRELGYPTANLKLAQKITLKEGVYAAKAHIGEKQYPSALFVGKPRNDWEKLSYELHVLDFSTDLYGSLIECEVLAFIDNPKHFESFEQLKKGISAQIDKIERFFLSK